MIDFNIRLNINNPGPQALVYTRQGDNMTSRICLRLYRDTIPVSLDGLTSFVLRLMKPDGFAIFKQAEKDGDTIIINIDGKLTEAPGSFDATIVCYEADGSLSHTPRFSVYVEEVLPDDSFIQSTDDFSALSAAMTSAVRFENAWSHPEVTVQNGDEPAGSVHLRGDKVVFDLTVQKGDPGVPAYIGDESGCVVETADDGILRAGRKIMVGTEEPDNVSGLRPGDIYVKLNS